MYRIDTSTASGSLPAPGAAGTPGYFTDGDPSGGIPATIVSADFLNAVQEEMAYVIEQSGAALNKADRTQLYAALLAIIAGVAPDASETVKGIIEIATAAEAQALASNSLAITPARLASAFQGSNQNFATAGYQKLPGGLIIQWAVGSNQGASGNQVVTLPITFPTSNVRSFVTNAYSTAAQNGGYGFISATASQVTVARNNVDNANGVTPLVLAIGY